MKLYIKNMACQCCIALVKDEVEKLGLEVESVAMGETEIRGNVSNEQLEELNTEIKKAGLEIIDNKKAILIEKIKQAVHEYVYDSKEKPQLNFSGFLTKQLNYDYSYLSRFFSEMHATTIEQFLINQKIDRAKELLLFHNLSLTMIADILHYSSVAHLSSQFKKVTGLTPSYFKALKHKRTLFSPQFSEKYGT